MRPAGGVRASHLLAANAVGIPTDELALTSTATTGGRQPQDGRPRPAVTVVPHPRRFLRPAQVPAQLAGHEPLQKPPSHLDCGGALPAGVHVDQTRRQAGVEQGALGSRHDPLGQVRRPRGDPLDQVQGFQQRQVGRQGFGLGCPRRWPRPATFNSARSGPRGTQESGRSSNRCKADSRRGVALVIRRT